MAERNREKPKPEKSTGKTPVISAPDKKTLPPIIKTRREKSKNHRTQDNL